MCKALRLESPIPTRNELGHHLVQGRYPEEPCCLTTAANSQAMLKHHCVGREDLPAAIQTGCPNHVVENFQLSKTVVL